MRYLFAVLFAGLAVIALLLGAVSPAASEAITLRLRRYYLNSRDTLEVVCPMGAHPVAQATFDTRSVQLRCVDDSLSPSPTPSAMPTHEHTSTPAASSTPGATSTPGNPPTSTPSSTPAGEEIRGAVDPAMLGTCSAAAHDRYVVRGPDGFLYRTWHPVEVPLDANNPGGGTCRFAHEHGQDPSTSLADSSPPVFGYVSVVGGLAIEAHAGFKVFVANVGTRNDEGRVSTHSSRIVAHMGTGGVMRYTMQFHSLEVDMIAGDGSGRYLHVQGLANTKQVGNICQRDARQGVGRTVMTLPSEGCVVQSLYEIWEFSLNLGNRATVLVSTAVFDPITVMDSADKTRVVYTHVAYAQQFGSFERHGCDAEAYHGPYYWYNAGRSTTFGTDAYGTAGSGLTQEVSSHSTNFSQVPAYNATNDGLTQFKLHASQCVPGLGLKN